MIFWVASYPKSGNTWLRALLASYYYSKDGTFDQKLLKKIEQFPQKKNFSNFDYDQKIVTDTSRFWIKAQELINLDKKLKFFKTHNILGGLNGNQFTNTKNTIGCIYIVRDPRNVITSLKNHFEMNDIDALEFMLNKNKYTYNYHVENDYSDFQFISSWENNYKSWRNQKNIPVKFIKYEDLYFKTYEIFKDLIEFYNLVNYIFDISLKLGSPARDNDVKNLRNEILTALSNKATFAELVPLFFTNANTAIDWVHKDLFEIKGNLKKAVEEMKK